MNINTEAAICMLNARVATLEKKEQERNRKEQENTRTIHCLLEEILQKGEQLLNIKKPQNR